MGREITTIKLSKSTVDILNNLKIHPRQPYEEVILEFIAKNRKNNGQNKGYGHRYSAHPRKGITTIKLAKKTAALLNKLKIHPRQSYEEAVLKIISGAKNAE